MKVARAPQRPQRDLSQGVFVLLTLLLCGLMVWLSGGMLDMIKAHMGL